MSHEEVFWEARRPNEAVVGQLVQGLTTAGQPFQGTLLSLAKHQTDGWNLHIESASGRHTLQVMDEISVSVTKKDWLVSEITGFSSSDQSPRGGW